MMQLYTLLPLWLLYAGLQVAQPAKPRLLWSDEFDYTGAPDAAKWRYDLGNGCPDFCGWGNEELQYYTDSQENVQVSGGKLVIEARQEQRDASPYTSSRLVTRGNASWKYAYVEVRAKLPEGRGTWPAIWMLPDTLAYGTWPRSGEIDIMEHVGFDPGVVHGTVHTKAFNHSIGTQVGKQHTVKDFSKAFHRYAINWTEEQIEFYIDGQLYHQFPNNGAGVDAWPFDQPFYLVLNIAVGGGWGGQKGVDPAIWPQRMEVDYVRVYEPLKTAAAKKAMARSQR